MRSASARRGGPCLFSGLGRLAVLLLAALVAGCRAAPERPHSPVADSGLELVVVAVDRLECLT